MTKIRCPRCGVTFAAEKVDRDFQGMCPRCLADIVLSPPDGNVTQPVSSVKPGMKFRGLEIAQILGQGGMGVVYKARQPALERWVALKLLSAELEKEPEFASRFQREAKALASLDHPNIVRVIDFGCEGAQHFLTMEFVDGVPLRTLLQERKISPEQALVIIRQICEALEYAHSKGVVHRDIKPENILVSREGRVKIADFGLAKIREVAPTAVTKTNVIMGTPQYMAPEQYDNLKQADHRADIYSLGVVFYEMLTGQLPMGRFDPPSKRAAVDERLDPVVLKALEHDPERRYQRAVHVKTDLNLARRRRVPRIAILAAAGGVLLGAALLWRLLSPDPEPPAPNRATPRAEGGAASRTVPPGPADEKFASLVSRLEKAKTIRATFRTETRAQEGQIGSGEGEFLLDGDKVKMWISTEKGRFEFVSDGKRMTGGGTPPADLRARVLPAITTIGVIEFLQEDLRTKPVTFHPEQHRLGNKSRINNVEVEELMLLIKVGGLSYGYGSKLYLGPDGLPLKRTVSPQRGGKWTSYSEWFETLELDVPIDASQFVVRG